MLLKATYFESRTGEINEISKFRMNECRPQIWTQVPCCHWLTASFCALNMDLINKYHPTVSYGLHMTKQSKKLLTFVN